MPRRARAPNGDAGQLRRTLLARPHPAQGTAPNAHGWGKDEGAGQASLGALTFTSRMNLGAGCPQWWPPPCALPSLRAASSVMCIMALAMRSFCLRLCKHSWKSAWCSLHSAGRAADFCGGGAGAGSAQAGARGDCASRKAAAARQAAGVPLPRLPATATPASRVVCLHGRLAATSAAQAAASAAPRAECAGRPAKVSYMALGKAVPEVVALGHATEESDAACHRVGRMVRESAASGGRFGCAAGALSWGDRERRVGRSGSARAAAAHGPPRGPDGNRRCTDSLRVRIRSLEFLEPCRFGRCGLRMPSRGVRARGSRTGADPPFPHQRSAIEAGGLLRALRPGYGASCIRVPLPVCGARLFLCRGRARRLGPNCSAALQRQAPARSGAPRAGCCLKRACWL